MRRPVVDRRRPVLLHRHIRRHCQPIGAGAVKRLACLVLRGHQVKLADPHMLRAEERHRIGDAPAIDWIAVRIGELALKSAYDIGQDRKHPLAALVVGSEHGFIFQLQPGMRLASGRIQDALGRVIGTERLALFDADRFQLVDHRLVTLQPRLALHEAIKRLVEAKIIGDRGIVERAKCVDKDGIGRLGRLAERIELDPLAIVDSHLDVWRAAAPGDRPKQSITLIIGRGQADIALWRLLFIAWRQDQIFAACTLVDAGRANIFERCLPGVHDAAVDDAIARRGYLDHHGAVLRVEESHEVDDVRIGRQRLVSPVEQSGPVDDLVGLAAEFEHLLVHEVIIDRWHAPDDGLDGTALDGAPQQFLSRAILRLCQRRSEHQGKPCES